VRPRGLGGSSLGPGGWARGLGGSSRGLDGRNGIGGRGAGGETRRRDRGACWRGGASVSCGSGRLRGLGGG
jgi:hypothetical protein